MENKKASKKAKTGNSICEKVRQMLLDGETDVEKIMTKAGAAKGTVMVQRHHLYAEGKLKKPAKAAKEKAAKKKEAK
jgi:hypothetical protein